MKLLLDENLSHRLLDLLADPFPGSSHIRLLGLERASDETIWEYARDNGFALVTQDTDFAERSILRGQPPKVILVRLGNTSTTNLRETLRLWTEAMREFLKNTDPGASLMEIEGR